MATLTDFRLRICAKLGLDNTVGGDQPLVDSWINEAVSETLTRIRTNVTVSTMALTNGTFDYTLPTQLLAIEEIYVTPATGTEQYMLYRKSPLEILQMRIGGSGGTPPVRFFALNGASLLMVFPTPNAADTLTVYGVSRPATLTAGSDTPSEIPVEWHKTIEYYGCWQAGQYANDGASQNGEAYRKLYEDELTKFKKAARQRGGRKMSPAVVGRGRMRVIGTPSQQGV